MSWTVETLANGQIRVTFSKPGATPRVALRKSTETKCACFFGVNVCPDVDHNWGNIVNCDDMDCDCNGC